MKNIVKTMKKMFPAGDYSTNYIAILLLLPGFLLILMPLLWMFSTSLRPGSKAFDLPPVWLPFDIIWDNFVSLTEASVPFVQFFVNSLKVSTLITVGVILTSALAGFAFACLHFRYKNILFFVLLSSLMIPVQVTIVPLYIINSKLGLLDTHWAIIFPFIANAFGVYLYRQFFMTVPRDLMEAAKLDGANYWTIFFKIYFPLAKTTTMALAVVMFTNTYNEYFLPLIFLSSWEKMTIPLGLVSLQNVYGSGNVGMLMSGVATAVLPLLIIFIVAQRYIIQGMLAGSVKG